MQINPNEIDEVEEAGQMNSAPVKLIRTKGGFWIAIGKKPGKAIEEALAAGSHPAIVKYTMEKQYPEFQPAMMKSETFIEPKVEQHSHFLPDDLRKSGYDIYSVQNGPSVEFHVSRHGITEKTVKASVEDAKLVFTRLPKMEQNLAKAFSAAVAEKTLSSGLKNISLGEKA